MHDSSPERRNLMATSLAFIAYFVAGGEVAGDVVRVQVVNIRFADPTALVVLAWTLLIWFAYRYWLIHRGAFSEALDKEVRFCSTKPYVKAYASRKWSESVVEDSEPGLHITGLYLIGTRLVANSQYAARIGRSRETYEANSYTDMEGKKDHPGQLEFTGFGGAFVKAQVLLDCFIRRPSFSSYVVPYLLFLFAVSLGIKDAL